MEPHSSPQSSQPWLNEELAAFGCILPLAGRELVFEACNERTQRTRDSDYISGLHGPELLGLILWEVSTAMESLGTGQQD